jgi:uncharacterized membrane protein YhiD involved in acid resistance
MPDWLVEKVSSDAPSTPRELLVRLLLALVFGGAVALVYRLSHGREQGTGLALTTTLVLLSVLIAMVSMVIGNSVARAFSLVGTLSIVRFRTVVEDTRDTAFVIFAVIVGMAAGAGLYWTAFIGVPVVGVASIGLTRLGNGLPGARPPECTLVVRMGLGYDPEAILSPVLSRHLDRQRVVAAGTARQGSALEVTYAARLKPSATMPTLVAELNRIEGVQSVELRES